MEKDDAVFWAEGIVTIAIGESYYEAYRKGKTNFVNNLYSYRNHTESREQLKQILREANKDFKDFFQTALFDDLNKPQFRYEMNVLFTAYNVLQIWKSIEMQQEKGKQHTYPQFLAKPFMKDKKLSGLDLHNEIHYTAAQDQALCYESRVYSDGLEQYYSIIEQEYSVLPTYSPDRKFTLHQRFIIALFLGTLYRRTAEAAYADYEHISLEDTKRDENYDFHIPFKIASDSFDKILLNRWTFIKTEGNGFPFHLGFPIIQNKLLANHLDDDRWTMSFTLKPDLKLILPPSKRHFMEKSFSRLMGGKIYTKQPMGSVSHFGSEDASIHDITRMLIHYDVETAYESVPKMLFFHYDLMKDATCNPYFDFSSFTEESGVRRIVEGKEGGIRPPIKGNYK